MKKQLLLLKQYSCKLAIIRLKAKFQLNIEFTLRHVLEVFTHLAITAPKVNKFG